MTEKLPTRLGKEPLLDAIFEFRFQAPMLLANILPGIFFSELDGPKELERLPTAEIPDQIRNADPNLQYAPLIRINWGGYSILIGDRSIAISCNLPYQGWASFRSAIEKVVGVLQKHPTLITKIERYSTKYVDLVPSSSLEEQVKMVDLDLRIGSKRLAKEAYQVRLELQTEGFINVLQVISGAKVLMPTGKEHEGLVIDIDTIKDLAEGLTLDQLNETLPTALGQIHQINKQTFFDCLSKEALNTLEPQYD